MKFERVTEVRPADGHIVPAFLLEPDAPVGGVAVCHGYGSSKIEMLGMAAALAEAGLAALVFDLRGHGEHSASVGPGVRDDFEAAVGYMRRYGPVGATGLSLGGRLTLVSSADVLAAISPSVVQEVSPRGQWMFANFPNPSVREPFPGYVVDLLKELGDVTPQDKPTLLLRSVRDIPNIIEGTQDLAKLFPNAELRVVTEETRPDVQHDNGLIRYLPRWFNHTELGVNSEAVHAVTGWLRTQLAA
ncbi:MAG: alpha/beta fold hydrolase [Anaerolineae bacterium]